MAHPVAAQPDPEEVLELEAWGQVSDCLVRDMVAAEDTLSGKKRYTQQIVLSAKETELRAMAVCDQSLAFHSLMVGFANMLSMVRQSNEAVEELLAWKDILESH
eukprot:353299_1